MYINDTSPKNTKSTKTHYTFNCLTDGALFRVSDNLFIRLSEEISDTYGNNFNCVNMVNGELDWFSPETEVDIYFADVDLDFSQFKSYKL